MVDSIENQALEFANEAPKAAGLKISLTRQQSSPSKKGTEIKQKSPPKKKLLPKKGRKDLTEIAKATVIIDPENQEPEEKITPQSALKQPLSADTDMMQ